MSGDEELGGLSVFNLGMDRPRYLPISHFRFTEGRPGIGTTSVIIRRISYIEERVNPIFNTLQ